MIKKSFLEKEYIKNGKSVSEIARGLSCSENKISYWLAKHDVRKRSISEAVYLKNNPKGDPFEFKAPKSAEEWFLYGLGLGLFWGEGNKANTQSVRLGNTDPDLIKVFLEFLESIFSIKTTRLRFGLQVFSDMDPDKAKNFWMKKLNIKTNQFQKVVVTKPFKKGTYRRKTRHGVLTVYFSNTKLRDSIGFAIEELRTTTYANVAQSVERIHGKSH